MTLPTAEAPARRHRLPNLSASAFDAIFGYAYALLMVNVMLVAANLPLVFFVVVVLDPVASWPFFLALSVTVAPSVAAAFGVFRAQADGSGDPVRGFWGAYRRSFRRAALVGLAVLAVLAVCALDLVAVSGTPLAPFAGPFFGLLGVVAVAVGTAVLAGLALYPSVRLRPLLAAAFYVSVRRWYFAAASVLCLAIAAGAVLLQPLLGAALAPSLMLFVVWSNIHFSFASAVESART